jgi:hypothetical protein
VHENEAGITDPPNMQSGPVNQETDTLMTYIDDYRLMSSPDKQRIGPDWRFFPSGPIQQVISSKTTSGMIGL